MNVFLYAKHTENMETFDKVICLFQNEDAAISIIVEGRRIFHELSRIMKNLKKGDAVIIGTLSSLGVSDAEIANRLDWFSKNNHILMICDHPTTYEYGILQPTNRAVLETILQSVIKRNGNLIEIPASKRSNSGRSKISFPDGWEEMFAQWEAGDISSKTFIERSGLKKATFYNMVTEYRALQESIHGYQERFGPQTKSG